VRRLLQAPGLLYDWHLGWLLGHRFLRLTHIGRRSGQTYETVLEVVGRNPAEGEFIVVAGLGRSAQWYQNLQVREAPEVAIARERFTPIHRELPIPEAEAVLAAYERHNRWLTRLIEPMLSWLVGWRYDGTEAARQRLVRELPLIGLRPAQPTDRGERPDRPFLGEQGGSGPPSSGESAARRRAR
jgi:deazaflavin-dependent oxidoreductase (nitroreductase family)